MELQEWKKKYGEEDTELTIEQVIQQHIIELEHEVEYFEKKRQSHGHQDIWITFLKSLLAGKNPKRKNWSEF